MNTPPKFSHSRQGSVEHNMPMNASHLQHPSLSATEAVDLLSQRTVMRSLLSPILLPLLTPRIEAVSHPRLPGPQTTRPLFIQAADLLLQTTGAKVGMLKKMTMTMMMMTTMTTRMMMTTMKTMMAMTTTVMTPSTMGKPRLAPTSANATTLPRTQSPRKQPVQRTRRATPTAPRMVEQLPESRSLPVVHAPVLIVDVSRCVVLALRRVRLAIVVATATTSASSKKAIVARRAARTKKPRPCSRACARWNRPSLPFFAVFVTLVLQRNTVAW